jgi:tRNA nucleotidyltransferase (CCA-adding enzyme)
VLAALPPALGPLLARLLGRADAGGIAVHLVGGPVRDYLVGRRLRDLDLLVEPGGGLDAAALARAAGGDGARVLAHDRFGTVRLVAREGELDLATARRESYAHPGALPRVAPGGLEDDLARRDFTVNALALPLSRSARRGRPRLVDPHGGLADLRARRLRALHARSFHDDPTRALRAARLAPRLGFRLAPSSRAALAAALAAGAVGRVSGDRLRRELERLFADAALGLDPARALRLLGSWGVLEAISPGLVLPAAARGPLRRLARSLRRPPWRWRELRPWVPGLALWLAPLPAGRRRAALERLTVTGEVGERLAAFPRDLARWRRALARRPGRGAVDRLLARVGDEWLLALHASLPEARARSVARFAAVDRSRRPPFSGADLAPLGLRGPELGRALAALRAAWLDGRVRSREDALRLLRRLVR